MRKKIFLSELGTVAVAAIMQSGYASKSVSAEQAMLNANIEALTSSFVFNGQSCCRGI